MSDNQNLLAEQRRALILDEVRRRGGVRVNELTRRLNVSDMTVRRDLDALARQGMVAKVHGGAVPVGEASTHEPGFEAKSVLELGAKEQIARAAARMVRPGTAIALSGGTTTYALARHLLDVPDLTVVTNSVRVADVFHEAQQEGSGAETRAGAATVVLTGGVRTPSDALVGPVADQAIRSLHFDALFLGVHGVSVEAGLSTPNLAEAETNRRLVRSARRVVVVADHTKWGTVGLSSFATLDEVDTLVTDAGLSGREREEMAEHLPGLVVAGEDDADAVVAADGRVGIPGPAGTAKAGGTAGTPSTADAADPAE
ncbi:DeoR/GlpR family DNA-binding transcription regulator [Streptomyces roseicoloratus]|uniref:DeoR/GlpR family DNA-binding transcription regulator n=1 Tax=Streptomyces roseicoloratus TaxID=2508722 RepID=A0ABY9S1G7_9ACTN|nr:DeoR/GlpR family DNA-binding transcription regulator [Streptomyces roseicoloratus]WMX48265.1 DeoR/GlpR family DNA-binding transcription regulator [Streptomyces roseicoloratus]